MIDMLLIIIRTNHNIANTNLYILLLILVLSNQNPTNDENKNTISFSIDYFIDGCMSIKYKR